MASGVSVTPVDDLADGVGWLTPVELRWLHRLQRALAACPSRRLELTTIGDKSLGVIDGNFARENDVDLEDGKAGRNGVELAYLSGGPIVHGISG